MGISIRRCRPDQPHTQMKRGATVEIARDTEHGHTDHVVQYGVAPPRYRHAPIRRRTDTFGCPTAPYRPRCQRRLTGRPGIGPSGHHFQARGQTFGDRLRHHAAVQTANRNGQQHLDEDSTCRLSTRAELLYEPITTPQSSRRVRIIRNASQQAVRFHVQRGGDPEREGRIRHPRRT